jgi:hypothetical protein
VAAAVFSASLAVVPLLKTGALLVIELPPPLLPEHAFSVNEIPIIKNVRARKCIQHPFKEKY